MVNTTTLCNGHCALVVDGSVCGTFDIDGDIDDDDNTDTPTLAVPTEHDDTYIHHTSVTVAVTTTLTTHSTCGAFP